jgi:acyl phosphate:glycerol-3-phosphate acyltransferase
METAALLLASYLLGSIPFGLIAAKIKGIDVTRTGSGNIGATNVFRSVGKLYGIAVFILDMAKGYVPVTLAASTGQGPFIVMLCGILAIAGHMFSPFMKFKGGKGVATGLGVILGIAPRLFILSFALGLVIIAATGYVSLASVTGSLFLSILMSRSGQPLPYVWMVFLITAFIVIKHIPNIRRLLNGTENKISWTKQ